MALSVHQMFHTFTRFKDRTGGSNVGNTSGRETRKETSRWRQNRVYLGRAVYNTGVEARSGTEPELKPERSPEWKRKTGPKRGPTPIENHHPRAAGQSQDTLQWKVSVPLGPMELYGPQETASLRK
ncbi:unnamed protein product [Xylocopa violacea]|uniref:Uncharacterized protein n=1 Tax=Xylocopa violacea TaxID=135666 RepID=A0ABP1NDH4_XYLVO